MTFSFEQLVRSLRRTAVHKCYVFLTHSTFSGTESKRCARERDATTDSIERESLSAWKEKSRLNDSEKLSHRYASFQWRTSECEGDSVMDAMHFMSHTIPSAEKQLLSENNEKRTSVINVNDSSPIKMKRTACI